MRRPGGGTVVMLCRALRERIAGALEHLYLDSDYSADARVVPQMINGYLPPKRSKDEHSEFPFVLVRPAEGSLNAEQSYTVRVAIIVGTFSEDIDGHEDALIALERIIQSLCESPTLDRRYQLQLPLTWELFDDQKQPYWHAVAVTEWTVHMPVVLPDEGVL